MATTWDASNKASDVTLTNSDLTASGTSGGGVRTGANGGAAGNIYVECVTSANDTFGGQMIGFCNASFAMTGDASASPNAISAWTDGNVYMNNGSTPVGAFGAGPWPSGTVISVCIDTTNKRFWARKNSGNWNNSGAANPATNTGGYAITNAGPYYGVFQGYNGVGYTLQVASQSVPSGFTDLMAASGASVALTGQGLTAAAGSIAKTAAVGLSGQAAAAARGALAPSATMSLAGQPATGAAGTLTVPGGTPLAGSEATTSAGSMGLGTTVVLAGASAATQRGSLAPGLSRSALGASIIGATGSASVAFAAPAAGNAAAVVQGALATGAAGGAYGALLVGAVAAGELGAPGAWSQAWTVAVGETAVWSDQSGDMAAWVVQPTTGADWPTQHGDAQSWTPLPPNPGSWP